MTGALSRLWREVLLPVWRALIREQTAFVAASIAFYGFLALLPSLLVIIVLYGTMADPHDVQRELAFMGRILPPHAETLLREQLAHMAAGSDQSHGAGAIISSLLALWSGSKGIRAILFAVRDSDKPPALRGRIRRAALAVALAGGAVLVVVIAVAAMMTFPEVLRRLGLSHTEATLIRLLRWPALAAIVFTWLSVLYRHGPARPELTWPDVVWGAAAATAVWLAGSAGFSFYAARFGSYDLVEGGLAGVVLLLVWLLVAAYAVLFGAELNRALERTRRPQG
jgi:membrane protein